MALELADETPSLHGVRDPLLSCRGLVRRFGEHLAVDGVTFPVDAKARIGFVPQDVAPYPDLTARENLRFFGRLYQLAGRSLDDRVNEQFHFTAGLVNLEIVSPLMRTIGHITPQSWAVDAWTILLSRNGNLVDLGPQLGVIALFAAGLISLATYRFGRRLT